MGSAIGAFSSMYSAMNRIDAGNNLISNAYDMNHNVAAASRQTIPFGVAQQREKNLMASNLQNSLMYKIASVQEDSQKAKDKKKIDYMA